MLERLRNGLLFLLLLGPAAGAQDALGTHRKALEPVLAAWEELADWCGKSQLLGRRTLLLEALLHFRPDDADARRTLGYRKQKDGTWKRSANRRAPQDRNSEALPEFESRRSAILGPFLERTLSTLDAQRDLPPTTRRVILLDLAALAPEEQRVRQLLGEVQVDGTWMLAESALALSRRPSLRARAAALLAEVEEPEATELPSLAGELELGVSHGFQVGGIRVAGPTEEITKKVARVSVAGVRFFNEAFGQNVKLARDCTIYVLPPARGRAFLEGHPEIAKDQIGFLEKLTATWAGFRDLAIWCATEAEILDSACRQCVDQLFGYAFQLGTQQGWLIEGMGFYLCPQVTGTRTMWFVVPTKYAGKALPLREKLTKSETDWYEEVARVIAAKDHLDLYALLAKPLNALSDEDILLAFLVSAYVIEGHPPEVASALMRAMAKVKHHAEAFESVLGLDLPTLESRLRRFLRETT